MSSAAPRTGTYNFPRYQTIEITTPCGQIEQTQTSSGKQPPGRPSVANNPASARIANNPHGADITKCVWKTRVSFATWRSSLACYRNLKTKSRKRKNWQRQSGTSSEELAKAERRPHLMTVNMLDTCTSQWSVARSQEAHHDILRYLTIHAAAPFGRDKQGDEVRVRERELGVELHLYLRCPRHARRVFRFLRTLTCSRSATSLRHNLPPTASCAWRT